MAYLSVKLDHVAALREVRKGRTPDPVQAAVLAEMAGSDSITIHLRRDRRHIKARDLVLLRQAVHSRLIVEISPTVENISAVMDIKADQVMLVPEDDGEVTTQSGFGPDSEWDSIEEAVARLQGAGLSCGLVVEPSADAIKRVSKLGLAGIRLFTGTYALARTETDGLAELERIEKAASAAARSDLVVSAGQGIDFQNLGPLVRLGVIDEFVVGQALIARALMVGMERAILAMLGIVRGGNAEG